MPLLLVAGAAAIGGFVVARGIDETGNLVKWLAIGGGVYVVGRQTGAW